MRKLIAGGFALVVLGLALFLLWPRGGQRGLVLYSALDYGPAIAKAYTAKTGVPVRIIDLSTGALLARITAEGSHPDWTLAWFDGDTAAVSLDHVGLLAHDLSPPDDLTALGHSMLPRDGAYVPTGFTLAGVFISARHTKFVAPSTWAELVAPAYHGVIGMNDPSISGPTFPALAGMLESSGGWPAGKNFIETLKADGLHIYAKNRTTLAALRTGAIKLAIVQSSAAIHDADTIDHDLVVTFPHPAYVLPNVITMANGLTPPRRQEAQRFIDFVNSPAAQAIRKQDGSGDSYYWPVTSGVAPHAGLPPLASLDLATLDASHWGALQNTITAWFAQHIVGAGP